MLSQYTKEFRYNVRNRDRSNRMIDRHDIPEFLPAVQEADVAKDDVSEKQQKLSKEFRVGDTVHMIAPTSSTESLKLFQKDIGLRKVKIAVGPFLIKRLQTMDS